MSRQLVNSVSTLANAGNDETLIRDLADVFLESSRELVNELCGALRDGDHESLARAAHTFKSPLGFFGATDSVQIAQTIEDQSKAESPEGLGGLVDQLLIDVSQVREELRCLEL